MLWQIETGLLEQLEAARADAELQAWLDAQEPLKPIPHKVPTWAQMRANTPAFNRRAA